MCQVLYKLHYNYIISFPPHNHLMEIDFIISILMVRTEAQTLTCHRARRQQKCATKSHALSYFLPALMPKAPCNSSVLTFPIVIVRPYSLLSVEK